MGYADSIKAVKKVQNYLELIVRNDVNEQYITVLRTDEPIKLSYQLREAKAYLGKMDHAYYNNNYSHLIPVTNYSFRVERDKVVARLSVPKATEESVPIFKPVECHTATGISDALTAIGYVVEHKNILKIIFPNLDISSNEIIKLTRWADKNRYRIELEENGASVSKIIEQSDAKLAESIHSK